MRDGRYLNIKSSIIHYPSFLIFLLLMFFLPPIYALTIDLKRGIEGGFAYAILNLHDKTPFNCKGVKKSEDKPIEYICTFKLMPKDLFKSIESDFFIISYKIKEKKFLLKILPTKKSKLFSLPPAIFEQSIIQTNPPKLSNHWIIVGYEKSLPFLDKKSYFKERLSFPIDWKDFAFPSVGAVDLNGDPVFIKNNRDVEMFMSIKEAFKTGKYSKAYDLSKESKELYPKSIFKTDFLSYEIKSLAAMDMKENAEEIIKLSKKFIKRYTSDEHLPEVLLILARVYSAVGFTSDANYFFDRVIYEHPDTKYANLGRIYLADQFYMSGKIKDALNLYKDALYNAKDLEVASLAAYKLAIRYLGQGKTKDGVAYLKKVWKKNPEFLLRDIEDAYRIAEQLASRNRYKFAIEINSTLIKRLKKLHPLYEDTLFKIAEWYNSLNSFKDALQWYERYLKEFAYGKYSDEAKEKIDTLFVAVSDTNTTVALQRYDELIKSYIGKSLGEKVFVAKLKLLLKMNRLDEIFMLQDKIDKIKDDELKQEAIRVLNSVVKIKFKSAISKNSCEDAIYLIDKFRYEPKSSYDEFLFSCFTKYAKYDEALNIAKRHLQDKDMDKRVLWLCRIVHLLRVKESGIEGYKALKELETLLSINKNVACSTLDFDKAWILYSMEKFSDYFAWIKRLLKKYPSKIELAEYLKKGDDLAQKSGDLTQQIWSLQSLIELQNRVGAHPYSPWAEFKLVKIFKKEGRDKEALGILKEMRRLKMQTDNRAMWLYMYGELLDKMGKKVESKKIFDECSKLKSKSSWVSLCKDMVNLN